MNFAEIIVNRRKALGLTQEGLAQKLGVTNQAVSKWESGQSCPDLALLPRIADLFGITIDELFGREPKAVAFPAQPPFPWPDDGVLRVLLYAGHTRVYGPVEGADEIHFCYEGPALNIESAVSVYCDDVMGNVTAGHSVNCDDVYGSISAQGSVNCDDVKGDIRAGGNVTCDCAEGDIHAGGNVQVDEASGDIHAGGSVYCDHWER
ncbi:MAG: helix-turn-helix domain-containing protein [Oscillospiraceae bacterium]|nr:helix-turn-helix domain-containing protein [Oscillospiraceae bacterium]